MARWKVVIQLYNNCRHTFVCKIHLCPHPFYYFYPDKALLIYIKFFCIKSFRQIHNPLKQVSLFQTDKEMQKNLCFFLISRQLTLYLGI